MKTDLNILLTALYVDLEDRVFPALGWSREHRAGRKPVLGDAELICLVVARQLLQVASDRRWIRYVRSHLRGMFPYLLGQSGYGKRLRAQSGLISAVITELARDVDSWHDLLRLVDSTPIPCGASTWARCIPASGSSSLASHQENQRRSCAAYRVWVAPE